MSFNVSRSSFYGLKGVLCPGRDTLTTHYFDLTCPSNAGQRNHNNRLTSYWIIFVKLVSKSSYNPYRHTTSRAAYSDKITLTCPLAIIKRIFIIIITLNKTFVNPSFVNYSWTVVLFYIIWCHSWKSYILFIEVEICFGMHIAEII